MITTDEADWQSELARAHHHPGALLERLGIPPGALPLAALADGFPMRVPESYVRRMRPGDPDDPLLLQVLVRAEEALRPPGFGTDPVGDLASRATASGLHKYHGRLLVVATGACGIHCRYCFRRHFPYGDFTPTDDALAETLAFIADHPDIDEVILSGGDPLSLNDRRLERLLRGFDQVPQLRRLRIHTRLPVVLERRLTPGLLKLFEGLATPLVVVVHANHANELDDAVAERLRALGRACAQLLNQSVLLRGVNDSCEALAALSQRLFESGVLPYYLHQLDPVAGAAHFQVDDTRALDLLDCLRRRLPGYLVPRLVRETAGAPFKIPLQETLTE